MRFFIFNEPYYALIKAKDETQAINIYNEVVADGEDDLLDEIKEVSRDYALIRFSRAPGEGGVFPSIKDVVEDFCRPVDEVLVIDGSLT